MTENPSPVSCELLEWFHAHSQRNNCSIWHVSALLWFFFYICVHTCRSESTEFIITGWDSHWVSTYSDSKTIKTRENVASTANKVCSMLHSWPRCKQFGEPSLSKHVLVVSQKSPFPFYEWNEMCTDVEKKRGGGSLNHSRSPMLGWRACF